jgi:hypothetical protein
MPTTDEPVAEELVGEPPTADALRAALGQRCGDDDGRLFALLDGARSPHLSVMLRELGVTARGLYRAGAEEELGHLMPSIAHVTLPGPLPLWLAVAPDMLESAVFLVSGATLEQLQTHFRRLLLVLDARGARNYLRFYDARVLPPLLEGSTEPERGQIFGPVEMFFALAGRDPDGAPIFREFRRPAALPPDLRPPSATHPFRLSERHEAVLARDALARYDARCVLWLRERFAGAVAGRTDADLQQLVARARTLGPALGLRAGRDVTTLAEALVLGFGGEDEAEIRRDPGPGRRATLEGIRDRLATERTASS